MSADETTQSVSRRNFLKGSIAAAGAAAIMGGLGAKEAKAANIPKKWDKVVDVICVGYGGAGASAAIAAHDAGAKVLLVEKMAEGGGNTVVSAGGFVSPTNVEDAMTYFTALFKLSFSEMDTGLVRIFAEESVDAADWVKTLQEGTKLSAYGGAGFPTVPGAKSMNKYGVVGAARGMNGQALNLWNLLTYAVEKKRNIEVMLNTPAKRLVINNDGEVIGLIAESEGKSIAIKANKGVILTTGGYEYDKTMLQNSLKAYPLYALGSPGNTGDGIRMAQKAGASLWHMTGCSAPLGIKVPEFEAAFYISVGAPGFIYVDKHAKRFVNEKSIEAHSSLLAVDFYDSVALEYPRIPCFAIFDENTRLTGPISTSTGRGYSGRRYKWSADNSEEIKKGWITKADTVAELAAKLKISPETLEETLNRWNKDVKSGGDTLFNRPLKAGAHGSVNKEHAMPVWSAPIEKGPYYAMELYPCIMNTQGGPRRNTKGQILDAFGAPISRLYSAGELGSMWGVIYQGGGNNAESLVFGRIAGRNAAAEKAWG
jgi:succinate dehydrogenase/fumarate reductase flavoprotein subunit